MEADAVEEKEELHGVPYVLPCSMRQRAEAQPVEHEAARPNRRASAYMWGQRDCQPGKEGNPSASVIIALLNHVHVVQVPPNMSLPMFMATSTAQQLLLSSTEGLKDAIKVACTAPQVAKNLH